jgi:hypothetical protein
VVLAVSKAESGHGAKPVEFYELGLGDPMPSVRCTALALATFSTRLCRSYRDGKS